jgi:hypothetical protein
VISATLQNIVRKNLKYFFTFIVLLWFLRIYEFSQIQLVGESTPKLSYLFSGMLIDILIALVLFGLSLFLQFLLSFIKIQRQFVLPLLSILYLIINLGTIIYFKESKVVLDESLFFFSLQELVMITNGVQGIPAVTYFLILGIILMTALLLRIFSKIKISKKGSLVFASLAILSVFFMGFTHYRSQKRIAQTYVNNRGAYFLWKSYVYFNNKILNVNQVYKASDFKDLQSSFFPSEIRDENFPLLHDLPDTESFGSYFRKSETGPPNIVLIIVEGLNSDFIGKYAESTGNAMPFLDSLRKESLYFPNFLTTCQRTYNVLPANLSSVPNSSGGKYTMENKFTPQMSLPNLLKSNYHSSFFCGVDLRFTDMDRYMKGIKTDYLVDNWEEKFRAPFNDYDRIWGFPDGYLFEKSLMDRAKNSNSNKSSLEVLLTISTHGPYAFPDQDGYERRALAKLKSSKVSQEIKNQIYREKFMMSSYTYTDTELRNYLAKARLMKGFENTIFIITGDHGTPFYSRNALSNFNVPLIIYSDLLKSPKTFNAVSSHLDIAPTIANYLRLDYGMKISKEVSFMGKGLDLTENYRNRNTLPFLAVNGKNEAMIDGNKLYVNGEVYKIDSDFTPKKINDQKTADYYQKQLTLYEKMSRYVFNQNNIVPLSSYNKIIGEDNFKVMFSKVSPKLEQPGNDMYLNLLSNLKIPKDIRKMKISVEMEVNVSSMKEILEFPKLISAANNLKPKKTEIFSDYAQLELFGIFQPNRYNRVSYETEIDLIKKPKIENEHEFGAFIYNVNQKNLDIRKVKVLVSGGK